MESIPSLPACRALLHEPKLLRLKTLHNMGVLDDLQFREGVAEVLAPKPLHVKPIICMVKPHVVSKSVWSHLVVLRIIFYPETQMNFNRLIGV
jgi:hypothetical protein